MNPVSLNTERLVLDQPRLDDIDLITHYCQDQAFAGPSMTTPWPYERQHAVGFVEQYVPSSWEVDGEYTWALRLDGTLIGMVGYRTTAHDIGYWLGAEYRGNRYMPEAVAAVVDWLFGTGVEEVVWETVVGNRASLSVARSCGFTYTGERRSWFAARDDGHPQAWQGLLRSTDSRRPKPGWPI
jgi:RimJ/RimL family protein N-acetyltransferase